jgi:hypothetical protein
MFGGCHWVTLASLARITPDHGRRGGVVMAVRGRAAAATAAGQGNTDQTAFSAAPGRAAVFDHGT